MRQVARKGLITVAAAGGILAATVGYAHADAGAQGGAANSPGVASGNNVQVPVHVPVNACGNTVNVVGLLNPAMGNSCANGSGEHRTSPGDGHHDQGGHGSTAKGGATGSPGVASGNNVQVPVDIPVNACGNSIDVVGALNGASGNECGNEAVPTRPTHPAEPGNPDNPGHPTGPEQPSHPQHPGEPVKEHPATPGLHPQTASHAKIATTPGPVRELAHTGAESIGYAASASAGLMLGGALLYRRARAARR